MKKILFKALVAFLATASLSSCLKDDSTVLDPAKGVNVIEFANPGAIVRVGMPYTMYAFSYFTNTTPSQPITVSYSGPEEVAPTDIVVNVAVGSSSTITAYNTAAGESNVMMNPNGYTFTGTQVVIKAGTSKATFSVPLRPANFDFSKQEVLPLTITSTSSGVVSGNFGTILLRLGARNIYDGYYSHQAGSMVTRYTNPTTPANDALSGSMAGNPDLTFTTVDANTIEIGNLRWSGGTSGVAGIDNLRATINPTTNQVTMSALGNATLRNVAGKTNAYDPATKTFTLNFDWNQTSTKREITLIVKYNRVR